MVYFLPANNVASLSYSYFRGQIFPGRRYGAGLYSVKRGERALLEESKVR